MHSCWVFNERMISILRPVIEYTEISEIPNYIPRIFILSRADRQTDAFVNNKSRIT
jgi:hypothetical protein